MAKKVKRKAAKSEVAKGKVTRSKLAKKKVIKGKVIRFKIENKNEKSTGKINKKIGSSFVCTHKDCKGKNKRYSSKSNLNNHVRTEHDGICWICHQCGVEQSSKFSLARHMQRKHPEKAIENLDEQKFQFKARKEMTTQAKDLLIKKLSLLYGQIREENKVLKNSLLAALFRISKLEKNKSALDELEVNVEESEAVNVDDKIQQQNGKIVMC